MLYYLLLLNLLLVYPLNFLMNAPSF